MSGKKVKVELVTGTVHHGALTAIEDEDCIVIDVEPRLPKPEPSTIVIRLSSVVWFGEAHPLLT